MELLLLYLWMKLPTLAVLNGVAILLCVILGFGIFPVEQDTTRWEIRVRQRLKWIIPALIALFVVIPSQTQTAVLVAGHYALRMADSPEASKVMQVLRKKANEYLDEELKEVKK